MMNTAMVASPAKDGDTQRPADVAPSPRLVQAAHEFEGQLMKELLRPMTGGDGFGEGDGDDCDAGSGGALGEFASEAMGRAMSERGGFGIADRIVKELSGSGNRNRAGKVAAGAHQNTAMRPMK